MVRGTPGVKRTRTISVRVSEAEWEAWEARRAASGRKEMGAWVRAVVLDAEGLGQVGVPGSQAGDIPVVPEVNEVAYAALVGAANNLNQLTRYSHQEEALAAGVSAAVAEVVAAARAVRGRRVLELAVPVVGPVEPAAQPDGALVPVDPWVSRPRRRVEPDVDAGTDGGSMAPASSAMPSPVSSSATEEDRRPAGWEAMSLSERARWLQDSGRTEQR